MNKTIATIIVLCILATVGITFAEEASDVNAQGKEYYDMAVDYRDNQNDGVKALESFEKAYNTGYDQAAEAACQIAWLYDSDEHGIPEDLEKGSAWLEKAVALGSSSAMTHLSMHYLWEKGVEKDVEQAESLALKGLEAATDDRDLMYAYNQLGRIYNTNDSPLFDQLKAAEYYEKSVQLYSPLQSDGQMLSAENLWTLALIYDNDGIKDTTESIIWYEAYIATNEESHRSEAMWRCGWLWYYEMKMRMNGLEWMRQSAEAGNADGMFYYAEALEKFENDVESAMLWYQKAADAGNESAKNRLTEIEK